MTRLTREEAIQKMREGQTVRHVTWAHGAVIFMEDAAGRDPWLVRRERLSDALKSTPNGGNGLNWEVVLKPCEPEEEPRCGAIPAAVATKAGS